MILREYEVGKFVKVSVINEIDFLAVNESHGFISVDLVPHSLSGYYLNDNGSFVVDTVREDLFILQENERSNKEIQLQLNIDSLNYLNSTDWYVVRFTETGVAIPLDVIEKRNIARLSIVHV